MRRLSQRHDLQAFVAAFAVFEGSVPGCLPLDTGPDAFFCKSSLDQSASQSRSASSHCVFGNDRADQQYRYNYCPVLWSQNLMLISIFARPIRRLLSLFYLQAGSRVVALSDRLRRLLPPCDRKARVQPYLPSSAGRMPLLYQAFCQRGPLTIEKDSAQHLTITHLGLIVGSLENTAPAAPPARHVRQLLS